jgi:hypothetical protein
VQGNLESEFNDLDSLRSLKILAARFHTLRRIFLCGLMALHANGEKSDFPRWNSAVDEIKALAAVTGGAEERLRSILEEEQSKFLAFSLWVKCLTAARLHDPPYSKAATESKSRTLASTITKARFSLNRYSRPSGKTPRLP